MGSLLSSIWGKLFKKDRDFQILIVGLANAGKTTLLYRMYWMLFL
jgi:GTPase SAR1 family protein